MKKTYKIKNYKGNLVESLKRFSDSHKGMKIIEACEEGEELKIKAEATKKKKEVTVTIDPNYKGREKFSFKYPANKDPDPEAIRLLRKKLGITPETYKEDPYKGDIEYTVYIDGKEVGGMAANICFAVYDEEVGTWADIEEDGPDDYYG